MTPLKPYLIRAIYEWIVDNHFTPHLLVNAEYPGVELPQDFIENGRIVLNVRPQAIQGLSLGNDEVEFNARFAGRAMRIIAPMGAVLAIYAKENGKGMMFDPEDYDDTPPPTQPEPEAPKVSKRPQLRIVK
ncbi:MAG: ClpXP protease specificity-enhancing factor [Methylomonas sp.]|nr:ClpXP protease specificity-enhancing factor [Methylomonas sp.]PPD19920.1 MAG: ClpXP protease specificity-enhancing factor [Methylomonas sp.]PPD39706.1 MAG: ClpXP protease specificity-enhancing factor [Methylomonas sp.]PPD55127.1 MAG: ClpXP protease specificity-enhancing factor [Methylomonas sp.]